MSVPSVCTWVAILFMNKKTGQKAKQPALFGLT